MFNNNTFPGFFACCDKKFKCLQKFRGLGPKIRGTKNQYYREESAEQWQMLKSTISVAVY